MASRGLILCVIDSLRPDALARAVATGAAPTLAALVRESDGIHPLVSVFPSVTPAAAATIATGAPVADHAIPSINWYARDEGRYVEYGTSLAAARVFGVLRVLTDTVYELNLAHLSRRVTTVFEKLEDHGIRTACSTYLVFRGRNRHEPVVGPGLARIATTTHFRHAVWGPAELFYADLFASRPLPCTSLLGLPGWRDPHSACVAEHLVRADAFDFLLLSLPDTDTRSHRLGPGGQVAALASADRALARVVAAAGGFASLLERYAIVVCSDHGQSAVHATIDLVSALDGLRVLRPNDPDPDLAEVAVSPGGRAAMVYILESDGRRRNRLQRELRRRLCALAGVRFVAYKERDEVVVASATAELRFAPGSEFRDEFGASWALEGDGAALSLELRGDAVRSARNPDALARLWSALAAPTSGDVVVCAEPGYEFVDWGGASHVGGGSHGGLDREDSLGVLVAVGLDRDPPRPPGGGRDNHPLRDACRLCDVAALVARHFEIADGAR